MCQGFSYDHHLAGINVMSKLAKKKGAELPFKAAFTGDQLSLFQSFLCNNDDERDRLSNTIELWDSIPKYSVSQQAMNKMRTDDGFLPRLEKTFFYRDRMYTARISAAIIDVEEGGEKAFYPSANEELIEDALRKIAAKQYRGFFDQNTYRSGVVFSINMLRKELKSRGHTRSYQEIIRSLNILAGSHIEIKLSDDSGIAKTNYLPALAAVSRAKLASDPNAKWVAHFHPLVTESIDSLSYRQFNYHVMMSHSTQLARWLHKRLSHNYTHASVMTPYTTLLSTVRRDSGLLEYARTNDVVRKFEEALGDLQKNDVVLAFNKEERRGERNKIEDIKYTLTPSPFFVKDVKAANKRLDDGRKLLERKTDRGRVVGIGRN
jgi:hypothetical protein